MSGGEERERHLLHVRNRLAFLRQHSIEEMRRKGMGRSVEDSERAPAYHSDDHTLQCIFWSGIVRLRLEEMESKIGSFSKPRAIG